MPVSTTSTGPQNCAQHGVSGNGRCGESACRNGPLSRRRAKRMQVSFELAFTWPIYGARKPALLNFAILATSANFLCSQDCAGGFLDLCLRWMTPCKGQD